MSSHGAGLRCVWVLGELADGSYSRAVEYERYLSTRLKNSVVVVFAIGS